MGNGTEVTEAESVQPLEWLSIEFVCDNCGHRWDEPGCLVGATAFWRPDKTKVACPKCLCWSLEPMATDGERVGDPNRAQRAKEESDVDEPITR